MCMNPWLNIWFKPKATVAKVVDENPNRSLWTLAWVYGFCSLMNLFQSMSLGAALGTGWILALAVVLAALWGYVNFTVWSWFVKLVGKWFGGKGNFKSIRCAYAWSCVPIVINVPLWLLMVITFGHQLFVNFPDAHLLGSGEILFLFVVLIVKVILAVWSLVIYLNGLAQVQDFSVLKAILNVIVAGIIVAAIFVGIWILLTALGGGSGTAAMMLWKLI